MTVVRMTVGRRDTRTPVKLAVFGGAALSLMGWLIVTVGNVNFFAHGTGYRALIADATGLSPGADVKVAGITVGKVDSISLSRGNAVVGFKVDKPIVLRRSTDDGLQWHDVLGTQDFYLYPGKRGPAVRAGQIIPLTHDITDVSVGKFLNDLGPFLTAVNPQESNAFIEAVSGAIEGDDAQITGLVESSASVSQTLGSLNGQIGTLIDNLSTVLAAVASKDGDVQTIVSNLSAIASDLASRNSVLKGVVDNLSVASQEFGGLVGANQSDLRDAITNLDAVLGTVASDQSDLSRGLGTLGSGLAPYIEISSYGQWFQVQTVYSCMAGQTDCTFYMPSQAPPGSPPVVTAPGYPQVPSPPQPPGPPGTTSQSPSLPGLLRVIAGGGSGS